MVKDRKLGWFLWEDLPLGAINNWLEERKKITNKDGALFVNKTGGRLTTRSIQLCLKKLAQSKDSPPINPHMLRHVATHMLESSETRLGNKNY